MTIDAAHAAMPVAKVAAYPADDPDGNAGIDQNRTLLDMRLDVGVDGRGGERRFTTPDPARVESLLRDMRSQRTTGIETHHRVQRLGRQQAEGRATADIMSRKPRHFLGTNRHQRNAAARSRAASSQPGQHAEADGDAGGAVEISAMRHCVEMRADHDDRQRGIKSGQRHVKIAGEIDARLEPDRARSLG